MATKKGNKNQENISKLEGKSMFPFTRENYVYMLLGLAIMIVGYLLMIGGKSPDPNEFYPEKIYGFRRITLAPLVIIIGVLVEIFAIFKKPKIEKA